MLESTLGDANQQARELRAASWERDGDGFSAWVPWLVSGGAILALAGVGLRSRFGRGGDR